MSSSGNGVAVVRFFAAVDDGIVVGSRSSTRSLTHAVIYEGPSGAFATFHISEDDAQAAAATFYGPLSKRVVEVAETTGRLQTGDLWEEGLRRA